MMMMRYHSSPLLALLVLLVSTASSNAEDLNLLMLGNSFSEGHKMEETLQAMLVANRDQLGDSITGIYADRFVHNSANLTDYLGTEVTEAITKERPWTWITLQEKSEIPGFYPPDDSDAREDMWERSLETILQLNREIQSAGATTVLMQTWGYFKEDPNNKDIYKSYQSMQDHITKGYELYYKEILKDAPESDVKIAPCGKAFEIVYGDIQVTGVDPTDGLTHFGRLYELNEWPARKHPSEEGAYLCACVLYQTLTGLDVRGTPLPSGLDMNIQPMYVKELQNAAYRAVEDYGTAPAVHPKTYRYGYDSQKRSRSSLAQFVLAFVLGGGILAGWIGWKWRSAAGTVRSTYRNGGYAHNYHLADAGDMVMELISSNSGGSGSNPQQSSYESEESRWINPV